MSARYVARMLVLIGACYSASVLAAPLTSADKNDDGAISRQEAMDAQNASFERLDDNGNDKLSRDEFDAGQPSAPEDASQADIARRKQVVSRWFDQIDDDGNASITPREYRDAVSPYFDRLDANHDGKISQQELRESFREVDEAQAELGG